MQNFTNNFLSNWINFWVFIFCITSIAITGHGGEAAIMLLFTMGYVFLSPNHNKLSFSLNKDEKIFLLLIFLFWLINLINTIFLPQGLEFENSRIALRAMDNPMRWLLMIPIFFLLRLYKIDWRVIAIGLSIGTFISVGIAAYQIYFLEFHRARGSFNNEITFGELMVVIDLLLWVLMLFAWNNKNKIYFFILFFASLLALYGSLLSITRGAWLVYLVLIISFILYAIKRGINNRSFLLSKPIIFRIFFTIVIFVFISQTNQYQLIKDRATQVFIETSQGNYQDAAGGRLVLFKTAFKISKHYPLGVGTNNFREGGKAVIILDAKNNSNIIVKDNNNLEIPIEGLIDNLNQFYYLQSFNQDGSLRYTSRFRHAHNEWLNVLAENGIIGFILLTLIFISSFKIFWKNINHKNELIGIYSYSGMLLIFSFAIFGQTQSIFTSHAALLFFIFFLFLFIAQISKLNNDDKLKKELLNS